MAEIKNIFIALMLVSLVILGISGFYSGLASHYGRPTSDLSYISRANNITDSISSIQQNITSSGITGIEFIDVPLSIVTGAFAVAKTMVSVLDLISGMAKDINLILGIPGIFILGITTIIAIVVVTWILSVALKWET